MNGLLVSWQLGCLTTSCLMPSLVNRKAGFGLVEVFSHHMWPQTRSTSLQPVVWGKLFTLILLPLEGIQHLVVFWILETTQNTHGEMLQTISQMTGKILVGPKVRQGTGTSDLAPNHQLYHSITMWPELPIISLVLSYPPSRKGEPA